MSDVDYAALAAKFGGKSDGATNDYAALAKQFGGQTESDSLPAQTTQDIPEIARMVRDITAGGLRGAASIGSTLLAPYDMAKDALAGKGLSLESNRQRRADIDEGLRLMGADPSSIGYGVGKIGAEIAGTMGAGGLIAKGMQATPTLAKFAPIVESGGFNLGEAATGSLAANAALRAGGGAVQGGAQAAMVDPSHAGTGAAIGAVSPGVIKAAGAAGTALSNKTDGLSRKLMASALKPTIEQWRTGQADRAISTMLDEGLNATAGGVDKIRGKIWDLNEEIMKAIQSSGGKVDRNKVIAAVGEARQKFLNQVNPSADLSAIDDVVGAFQSHPFFQSIEARGPEFKDALALAKKGKEQALQAAGKLKTFSAQQGQLADGDVVSLATKQPENQLYFNVGEMGGGAKSPQAWPVEGMPRFPSRYTQNIDRVPEGEAGYQDAMAAYLARRNDEAAAQQALAEWESSVGQLPVEIAQKLKQGTYRVLKGKYGEVGSASTEAQKALARGLKEGISEAVPAVAPLNARESALLDALAVAERRAMMDANKNPFGLSSLSPSPAGFMAFMADRSGQLKSLLARGTYGASKAEVPQTLADLLENRGLLGIPSVITSSP